MTAGEYREEGFRLYETDLNQALECFQKAAEGKDFLSAMALASHFFGFCEDDSIPAMKWYENKQSAIQWINKAEKWFNEAGKPAELNEAMAEGFYMRGILQKSQYPFSALLDFYRAFDMGMMEALSHYGKLIYEGANTPDRHPEVDKGIEIWKYGMEQGDEECTRLYHEHLFEKTPENAKAIRFGNGNNYKGQLNEAGLPHGSGRMKYESGDEYVGEWRDGKRCGYGKFEGSDYKYMGEWLDDKEHGQGISIRTCERGLHRCTIHSKYTGEFKEGKENCHGVLLEDSYENDLSGPPDRFEGEFKDGKLMGHGTCQYHNGDYYEGEFRGCSQHGQGTYTYANGLKINGTWENGNLVFESLQCEPPTEMPILFVSKYDQGMDYSHYNSFLVMPKVGDIAFKDAIALSKGYQTEEERVMITVNEVTNNSVTFIVRDSYINKENEAVTLHRGEEKVYERISDHTVTIEGDDYDYTSKFRFTFKCK